MYYKLFEDSKGRQVALSNKGGFAFSRDLKIIDDLVHKYTMDDSDVDNLLNCLDSFIKSRDSCKFMYINEGYPRIINKGIEIVIGFYHIEIHEFKSYKDTCENISNDKLMVYYKNFLEYYNDNK